MKDTVLDKYYRALDALLELETYDHDGIRPSVNYLRDRIASMQTDMDELEFKIDRIEKFPEE
ncbi:hypothetical protein [Parapedobacter sp. 10938]|uniref:hypothetical protein n=1 Tax=Parapedobacter flavus TaxID=3110225 RepID=UPI002DBD42F9|nr:hypothetical protein [Parapedobacter sp. 10938]MEC3881840.1 hypothetical protein [Parapedobacter sp. 10938]